MASLFGRRMDFSLGITHPMHFPSHCMEEKERLPSAGSWRIFPMRPGRCAPCLPPFSSLGDTTSSPSCVSSDLSFLQHVWVEKGGHTPTFLCIYSMCLAWHALALSRQQHLETPAHGLASFPLWRWAGVAFLYVSCLSWEKMFRRH